VKPHIRIRGVGGKHAYNGLYGAMSTIRKEMHSYLECSTKLTRLVSLHENLNRKKYPMYYN
jgi:hypothetical protein